MEINGFRGRTFAAVMAVTTVALVVAGTLASLALRPLLLRSLERGLVAQTRLTATLLRDRLAAQGTFDADREADRIGQLTGARVTLLAPDGRVLGDSTVELPALAQVDNHAGRPEVIEAIRLGLGTSRRHSDTVGTDMLYAAVALSGSPIRIVRLALPLTDVNEQVESVRRSMLTAGVIALVCALALAWVSSLVLTRRVKAIASTATRYAAGDFSEPMLEYGHDE